MIGFVFESIALILEISIFWNDLSKLIGKLNPDFEKEYASKYLDSFSTISSSVLDAILIKLRVKS